MSAVPILPDIVRGIITNVLFASFLLSLARPRHRMRVMIVPAVVMVLANVAIDSAFYVRGDHTTPVLVSAFVMVPWCFAMKPLVRDTVMQWFFDVVTAANLFAVIVFCSWWVARLAPSPEYLDTGVRVVLFTVAIVSFRRFLRPAYLSVLDHWSSFFSATLGVLSCFVYEYGFTGGVEQAIEGDAVLLGLLSLTTGLIYAVILLSIRSIAQSCQLRDAAARSGARQEALQAELESEQAYVEMARRSRHDQRHHDSVVLGYLEQGSVGEAVTYLRGVDNRSETQAIVRLCENTVANAVLRITARRCDSSGIDFACDAIIPAQLPISPAETGELIGNLLENACEACEQTYDADGGAPSRSVRPVIEFKASLAGSQLRIEERNTIVRPVDFVGGRPVSTKLLDGGVGTESMRSIVESAGGMIRFVQRDQRFVVQIVLPV